MINFFSKKNFFLFLITIFLVAPISSSAISSNIDINLSVKSSSGSSGSETVPPVTDFLASNEGVPEINLSWQNPIFANFHSVIIIRRTDRYPSLVTDGTQIYSGSEDNFIDSDILRGQKYYYAIFVNSTLGNYSEPALAEDVVPLITPVPTALSFYATFNEVSENVILSWQNPIFANFHSAVLVRSSSPVILSIEDGEVIYDGQGEEFFDDNIIRGQDYYYALFIKSTTGEYSSPLVAYITIPEIDDEEEEEEEDTEGEEDDEEDVIDDQVVTDDETGTHDDPFDLLPEEIIYPSGDIFFIFRQIDRRDQNFTDGERIKILAGKEFSVLLEKNLAPESLKTIAVSAIDHNGKSFSFLMRIDNANLYYSALISPLSAGEYQLRIYLINYEDQTVMRYGGVLDVVDGPIFPTDPVEIVTKVGLPITSGVGVVAGALQTVIMASGAGSLFDIYLLLIRWLGYLLTLFGLRKRRRPWGTVYDSVTKQPIDPAYVLVTREGKPDDEVSTAITDIDGRYGLLLSPGSYMIKASKTNYRFPSEKLVGKNDDIIYNNLYFGETFQTSPERVINYDIPMDPIGFDWNEFIKGGSEYFNFYSRREIIKAKIFNGLLYLGFLSAVFSMAVTPSWFNIIIIAIYLSIFSVRIYWRINYPPVKILDNFGKPLSFAILRFYLADIDQEVKQVVADHLGRFYTLLRPGRYYFTIEEKLPDESYRLIYRSPVSDLKKGVIKKNVVVNRSEVDSSFNN